MPNSTQFTLVYPTVAHGFIQEIQINNPRFDLLLCVTDLNTWIAGSHGFAYSSMRATGNTSAAILLQSKHSIDTLTSTHISA